jgi:hypothetical protein
MASQTYVLVSDFTLDQFRRSVNHLPGIPL